MSTDIATVPYVHDQVHVECLIDGHLVGFRAVVVNVQQASLWMGLAQPDPALERLERNQPVHLTFKRDNAAVVADAAFLAHLGSSKSRLFSVEMPPQMQLVQRRAHIRLEVDCPIAIEVVRGRPQDVGLEGGGRTRNISAGGLLFVTGVAVAAADEIALRVDLGAEGVVSAEAVVVRTEPCVDASGPATPARPEMLVAVRFLAISEVEQDKIVRRIFTVQRARREDAKRPS